MVEAIRENAIAANMWLITVLALFHVAVMALLGLAIWRTMTYRDPLHEEFSGSLPTEGEGPHPAPEAARPERPL